MSRTRNELKRRRRARFVQILTGCIMIAGNIFAICIAKYASIPSVIVILLGTYLIVTPHLFVKEW